MKRIRLKFKPKPQQIDTLMFFLLTHTKIGAMKCTRCGRWHHPSRITYVTGLPRDYGCDFYSDSAGYDLLCNRCFDALTDKFTEKETVNA